jgi:serine/threonine protein kinase
MLGTGGMGVIYLAEDSVAGNAPCVVKQLNSKYADPEERSEAVRLFIREAALLKSLNHPGVVRFFDSYSTEDGKHYLVMDYVRGSSLESVINDFGAFNDDDTVKVGIQICEVLEYLHDQEPPIIYRDLKPSNLMLTPEGQIVFIDFGIARTFMPKESATRVVTAGYSPPEQYFGKPETRSDLYALGATIGHLLTGVRPKPLTASQPRQHRADVHPNLDALVKQLTSHSPEDRPATARHVRHTLYRIYQEMHAEFEIPDEVFLQRSNSTKEEQYISQKIMKSGMAAAASALKQEQDNERKRQSASDSSGKASFDRLRSFGTRDPNPSASSRNPRDSGSQKGQSQKSTSQRNTVQKNTSQRGTSQKNQRSSQRNSGRNYSDQSDSSDDDPAVSRSRMKSVRDLRPVEEKNFFTKILDWFRR